MMNLTKTVAAAVRRAPETFSLRDLEPLMRELSPRLAYKPHSPYSALDALEARGEVVVCERAWRSSGVKTWRKAGSDGQPELDFGPSGPAEAVRWDPVKGGAVQGAALEALKGLGAEVTSLDVESAVRRRDPALFGAMSKGAVSGALAALEHRGVVERTGRRVGRRLLWRNLLSAERVQ